jgi:hypothetical protein
MNRNQFIILLVLVAVLGGAGLVLYNKENKSWTGGGQTAGQKLIRDFQVNDVAHIVIKQANQELNLAKKEDLWRVRERSDYPANFSEISGLLLKLRDLKIVQSEKVGASQLPRLELAAGPGTNSATVLELRDGSEKVIRSLSLGKKHTRKSSRPSPMGDMGDEGWPDGRYVMLGGSSDVALISEPLANIEPKPDPWLNKDFFKVEKVRSVAVTFANATNSWKLDRETESGEWKLADAKPEEKLDSAKASGVSNPLSSPSFVDVMIGAAPEQSGLDKPTLIALETFDHFSYAVKVGTKTNDNYPFTMTVTATISKERAPGKDEKTEDKEKLDKEFTEKQKKLEEKLTQEKAFEKWTYLVSGWTVDSLLKERSQLLAEKKDEQKDKPEAKDGDLKPEDKPAEAKKEN